MPLVEREARALYTRAQPKQISGAITACEHSPPTDNPRLSSVRNVARFLARNHPYRIVPISYVSTPLRTRRRLGV